MDNDEVNTIAIEPGGSNVTAADTAAVSAYAAEVDNYGSAKPVFPRKLSHRIDLDANAVVTDGKGNIVAMPLLTSKPCFGRVEYGLRHRQPPYEMVRARHGAMVIAQSKCSRCPSGTRAACNTVVKERAAAVPEIRKAIRLWDNACRAERRVWTFTGGDVGWAWKAVRTAIANHGPFENVNDKALGRHAAAEDAAERAKDAARKRHERFLQRMRARDCRREPPEFFVDAAERCRLARMAGLNALISQPGRPRRFVKLTSRGCEVTANAWFGFEMLKASGERPGPGRLATWLIENQLHSGHTYQSLRDRLRRDLERVAWLDRSPQFSAAWPPFDPDGE